jgi:hypothetical protein
VDATPSAVEQTEVAVQKSTSPGSETGPFVVPGKISAEYTDGRLPGDWETKYAAKARRCINQEACALAAGMVFFCLVDGILLGMSGQTIIWPLNFLGNQADGSATVARIDVRLLTIFFIGCLGGTTFSVKWLIHSVAKSKWHLDRRYWRIFVPLNGATNLQDQARSKV